MIVLNTNVISEVFKPAPDPRVVAWLASLTGEVALTAITHAELLAGIQLMPDGQRKRSLAQAVDQAVTPYRASRAILPFDDRAAEHYAIILGLRQAAGLPIATADAQIAAICRSHTATLATRNAKDFEAIGVLLVNPWEV